MIRSMKRAMRRLILITLLLLLLPLLFGGWVIGTSEGLRWLLVRALPANALRIDTLEGNLLGTLRLKGLHYQDGKWRISLDEAALNWHPESLWHNQARVEMLYLQHLHVEQLSRDDTPLQLPNLHLPLTLRLDDLQVNDLNIALLQQPAIRINNASLSGRADHDGVELKYLNVSSDALQLTVQGKLHPYDHYWHDLELQWQLQLANQPTLNGRGQLTGDLRQTTLYHQLTLPIDAETELTLFDLLQKLRWQATVKLSKQPLNAIHESWPAEKVALSARGSGDLHHATIDGFTLNALNSTVHGSGALDWQNKLLWQADVDSKRFDLAALWALLKVTKAPMIGVGVKARLSGDLEQLEARDVTLLGLGGSVSGTAQVRWSRPLHWRTRFQARQLELTQLWPLLYIAAPELPTGRADLAATLDGDGKGLAFSQVTLQAHGATVHAGGQLQWQPQLQWQAKVDGSGINPALWLPGQLAGWPGDLATQFQIKGKSINHELLGNLDIKQLNGTLRGYPFELQSQLALAPQQQLAVKAFQLSSAASHIEAHGRIGKEMELSWQLDSPQLAQLHPAVQGALKLDGELSGPSSEPLLQLTLEGKSLAYAGQQIGALKGHAKVQLFNWRQLLVELHARELQLAGHAIDAVDIDTRGTAADHQLQLHLKMAQLETQWRLKGGFEASKQEWRGHITQADLDNQRLGLWQLKGPAALSASRTRLQLAPLCWQQHTAQICLDGQRHDDEWQGSVQGQRLALALLSPWLPRELEIAGEVTVNGSVHYTPQQPLTAEAQISVGAGHVSYPIIEGARSQWPFQHGQWRATLDSHGLRTQLQLALTGKDQISATLELPGYEPLTTALAQQPMKGAMSAAFSDLGILNNLLYETQGLQGHIELNSQIGGTVTQPALAGQLQLRDGRLQIPRLGLSLTGLQFDAHSSGDDEVSYRLQVHSGDGAIEANGQTRLNPKEGWPTHITLTGEKFEVSHIPEARVVVNPKLEMKMARREIWLDGQVLVPQARLEPKELTSATTVSSDVVIVGAPKPAQPPWQIHNRVRLILGDRVSLYGFGFEGRIGGNLLLIDEPGKPTAASGELNVVEGHYRAYGQNLTVEQGRLLFAGGPITNPALDLRAVRKVQDVTAGIKVYGPLRQPQFELFSTPAMDQTNILAYLVLGAPLESTTSTSQGAVMAQAALALGLKGGDLLARSIGTRFGFEEMHIETTSSTTRTTRTTAATGTTGATGEQTSLVMGRYLSPRLYVGYGVGLIDAVNTLNIRYQLSQHWQIKAETGAAQGADLTYTIDR